MRNVKWWCGFAEIDEEVAAVLAFVISSATLLAAQITKRGDARRYAESRFPVSSFTNIDRRAANDKDFSLALEMTTRESPMPPSLLVS